MKELYFFLGGAGAVILAQFIFNYNFSDWLKDKVLALFGKVKTEVTAKELAIKAEVKAEIAKFKPKAKK